MSGKKYVNLANNKYLKGFLECCIPLSCFLCCNASSSDDPESTKEVFEVAKTSLNSLLENSITDAQLRHAFIQTNSNFWDAIEHGDLTQAAGINDQWDALLMRYVEKYRGELSIMRPFGEEINEAERFLCNKVRDAVKQYFTSKDQPQAEVAVDKILIHFEDALVEATNVVMDYDENASQSIDAGVALAQDVQITGGIEEYKSGEIIDSIVPII